jgi:hypothetical protein
VEILKKNLMTLPTIVTEHQRDHRLQWETSRDCTAISFVLRNIWT